MVTKANSENLAADMSPPNYRAAVQRIRSIPAKKVKVSSINGDIADIWSKVEGHKVFKQAGRAFLKLDGMEHVERMRFMRDLNGLIDAAGWPTEDEDMVDMAEGRKVQMRVGASGDPDPDDEDDLDLDDDDDSDEGDSQGIDLDAPGKEDKEGAGGQRSAGFLARARRHLNVVPAEPYTGDNSDLAGDDVVRH